MKEVSASFLTKKNYSESIKILNNSNTDYIHFDVMDGKFVKEKNLTVKELLKYLDLSSKKNDVHLMVSSPKNYIDALSYYNVDYITIHKEIKNYKDMINLIKSYGLKAGLAISPDTDVESIYSDLKDVSLVLVMGVNPGRSGQSFIESTKDKIDKLKNKIKEDNLNVKVSVDGGINEDVLEKVCNADIIVSASYILEDINNIDKIKNC